MRNNTQKKTGYNLPRLFALLFLLAMSVGIVPFSFAEKRGFRLHTKGAYSEDSKEREMTAGSFMVASQCEDCNNGYRLDQISFSGYDKPQQSMKETFFITNNTDRTMTGVTLYIDYLDMQGRQLNKKYYKLSCLIPPGETRQAELTTWDKQKMFYYELSVPGRRGGVPFKITIDPVAYYLRF